MTGQARAAVDTVLAFASDTGRACTAGALYAVAKRCRAPADRVLSVAPWGDGAGVGVIADEVAVLARRVLVAVLARGLVAAEGFVEVLLGRR
jgi:hypothetical protein